LWRLEGFRTKIIELTIPRGRQRQGPGIVYRRVLLPGDVTTIDDLPVTTLPRTLIDLAAVVSRDQLEEALDDASRRGLVTMARLRSRLDRYGRGRHGVGILRALLDERDHSARPLGSALERKALRMFRAERLPEPIPQFRVRSGNRLIATVDFAYPELLLGIEVDGYRWHTGRKRFVEDRRRLNALTSLGWRIIHVVWEDLQHGRPDAIDTIRRSIASRGEEL
jgi:very-short-patch-repair endonuclease